MACAKVEVMLVLMMGLCGVCFGEVYRVGDDAGWVVIPTVDYARWAAEKSFHVGDTIRFVYNALFHDVVEVTGHDYELCQANSVATYNTGNDSIVLDSPGRFYFICSTLGHCNLGQKVAIHVTKPGPAPSPGLTHA